MYLLMMQLEKKVELILIGKLNNTVLADIGFKMNY